MKNKITELIKILDPSEFSIAPEEIKKYNVDWRGVYIGKSNLVIFPTSIKKLSKILSFCQKKNIGVVPQGGNTGLVGGAVPRNGKNDVIISLSKLNKIRDVDLIGNCITVEGGCILDDIKNKLLEYDLEFPLSMGSRGDCQIGGNISTNAGGVNVIKYGTIRQNVLGIEAVFPDGTIFSSLKNVKKNNTGLDMKQLLIGTEGILGIITAATIKTYPLPKEKVVMWASFKSFKDVLNFYIYVTKIFNDSITSFEFMNKESIEILEKNEVKVKNLKKNECYCLVEFSNFQTIKNFNDFVCSKINHNILNTDDVIISKSEQENKTFWNYRESIPLAEKKENFIIPHDISIPLKNIEDFISSTTKSIKKYKKHSSIINFGHLGDNNLHFNVLINKHSENQKKKIIKSINRIIFDNVKKFEGAISAEHGIGQLRKKELKIHKTNSEINIMKKIKRVFDPNNILNQGKVI
tara:strand:- start:1651 stop:3042 length:1392 start_codon:yes stop_codon:yes gene_type:complete